MSHTDQITSARTGRAPLFEARPCGRSGAYVDGPFKTAAAAQRRKAAYRPAGWGRRTHVLRAASREEAVAALESRLARLEKGRP